MSVMDKLMNAMKFNDDEEEFGDEELDEEYYDNSREVPADRVSMEEAEEEEEAPVRKEETAPRLRRKASEARNDNLPTRSRREYAPSSDSGGQVCIIRPTSVNDAREVTDTLLDGSTVVLNLEGLDVEIAQRIIDFTSGSCYAVGGNVQKISHYIFVITPSNIDVSGDLTARETVSRDGGSLNMNFASRS